MLCTFCGTENSPENKFCGMCGVKLERRKMERRVRHGAASLKCASCGQVSEPGNTFCGMCGARIERRLGDRRGSQDRATAIANFQLPSPEVPGGEQVPQPKQSAANPVAETALEAARESELSAATPPAEEIPARPPAAIFRSAPAEPSDTAERPASPKRSIAGPSFLGLNDDLPGSGDYLLEEEKSSGGVVRIVIFLCVLALALGLVYLKWGPNLRAMLKLDGPSKAAAPVATPAEEQKPKPDTSPTPETTTTAATPQPSPSPETADANDKAVEAQPDTAKAPATATTDSSSPDKTKTEDVASRAAKNAAAKKDKAREEPSLKPSPALLKAQDYLQGRNGVKQDCDQGLTYLRAAVQRSEPAAAMQMGELYASGHCVQQDRVTAYRWMNSAREKVPGNGAIQMSMDTLWGRMTPQERKEAGH